MSETTQPESTLQWQLASGEEREIKNGESGNDHFYFILKEGLDPNKEDTPVQLSEGSIQRIVGLTDNPKEIVGFPKWRESGEVERVRHETGKGYHHVGFPDGTLRRLWHNPSAFRYSETYGTYLPLIDFTKQKVEILDPRESLKKRWNESMPQMQGIRYLVEEIGKIDPAITPDMFGLDASLLVGIEKPDSDIDLTFHGNQEMALKAYAAYDKLKSDNDGLVTPRQIRETLVARRRPYSPFASDDEIVEMEERKMSAWVKVGDEKFKFSILPVDSTAKTDFSLQPRGIVCAVSGTIDQERVVFEPDYVPMQNVNVIYGPDESKVAALYSALPSRTGLLLKDGDRIFTMGELATMTKSDGSKQEVIIQFPWTEFTMGGKKLTTNILLGDEPKWREVADYMLKDTFGKPAPDIDHNAK